jgi:hypothetical protein
VLTIFISLLIVLVSSSPIDPPQISYGREASKEDHQTHGWIWEEVTSPLMAGSNKVPFGLLQKKLKYIYFIFSIYSNMHYHLFLRSAGEGFVIASQAQYTQNPGY